MFANTESQLRIAHISCEMLHFSSDILLPNKESQLRVAHIVGTPTPDRMQETCLATTKSSIKNAENRKSQKKTERVHRI